MYEHSFRLTGPALNLLDQIIQYDGRPAVKNAACAVRLLHIGTPLRFAARVYGVYPDTLRRWHDQFCEHGVAGLEDACRTVGQ